MLHSSHFQIMILHLQLTRKSLILCTLYFLFIFLPFARNASGLSISTHCFLPAVLQFPGCMCALFIPVLETVLLNLLKAQRTTWSHVLEKTVSIATFSELYLMQRRHSRQIRKFHNGAIFISRSDSSTIFVRRRDFAVFTKPIHETRKWCEISLLCCKISVPAI